LSSRTPIDTKAATWTFSLLGTDAADISAADGIDVWLVIGGYEGHVWLDADRKIALSYSVK